MSERATVEICVSGCALALVFALGALNLNYPFVADHVMALLGAKALAAGGTLYVDFWDNKMPGLYWFYQLAGTWFGFTEFGVHGLDLLWMMGFAIALVVALRDYCAYPWMSGLAALAVVGVYYASAEAFHLTQIEILSAFPLFLCAWFASRIAWHGWRLSLAFALSGVLAGVVVTFKLVLAPLCVAFWLVAAAHARVDRGLPLASLALRMALPAVAGLSCVLGVIVLVFWRDGGLAALLWTAFEYPKVALISAPQAPYLRLAQSSVFFVSFYLAWAFFIVLAIADWWQSERHVMTSMLLAWLVVALGLILIQRFSWWSYHFQLLFAPAGILGVRGIGVIPRILRARGAVGDELAVLLVIALAFPAIGSLAIPTDQKLSMLVEVFVKKRGDSAEVHRLLNPKYAQIGQSIRFLKASTARPGPIYVFGDPLYYHLSDRDPALPIPGWAWQYFLQTQWLRLPGQLEQAMPAYIYVDSESVKIMQARGGGVREYITTAYAPFVADHDGTWYQIRPDLWRERHGG